MCAIVPVVEQCIVGKETNAVCHKKSYARKMKIIPMELLMASEKQILSFRYGANIDLLTNVWEHYKTFYFRKHELFQPHVILIK